MSTGEQEQGFVSMWELLESEVITPKQIVHAMAHNPIYSAVFDTDPFLADPINADLVSDALGLYVKKLRIEHELRDLQMEIEMLEDFQPLLRNYGWLRENLPKFELQLFDSAEYELPEMGKRILMTEGRFIAALLAEVGIDVEALQAGDAAQFKEVQRISKGRVDRKPLSNMLHRWGVRLRKSRSSPSKS